MINFIKNLFKPKFVPQDEIQEFLVSINFKQCSVNKNELIMDIANAYNSWSSQYDTNDNKTRDLEALSLQKILQGKSFKHCLEIGCGTGHNFPVLTRFGVVDGLGHKVVRATTNHGHHPLGVTLGREHDDRQVAVECHQPLERRLTALDHLKRHIGRHHLGHRGRRQAVKIVHHHPQAPPCARWNTAV